MSEEKLEDVETKTSKKKHVDHRWSVGIIAGIIIVSALVGVFVYKYYNDQAINAYDSVKTVLLPKASQAEHTAVTTNQQLDTKYQSAGTELNALDNETKDVDSSLNDSSVDLSY